jgi:predicted transcriptional regulator
MTPAKIARARELYEQRDLTVVEIAKTLGVSRASVYRHLPRLKTGPTATAADAAPRDEALKGTELSGVGHAEPLHRRSR